MYSSIGSMMLGWDYVSGSQLASLPEFRRQFGVLQPDGSHLIPSYVLSSWQAIGPAAHVIAAIIAAPLLEKWGRKPQIIVVLVLSLAGVLMQQLATEWTLHLGGRLVNGTFAASSESLHCSHISLRRRLDRHHVHHLSSVDRRELQAGAARFLPLLLQHQHCFGPVLHVGTPSSSSQQRPSTDPASVVIGYGSSHIEGKWQWWTVIVSMYFLPGAPRLSVLLQRGPRLTPRRPAVLLVFYPWFPESPYWLIRENKPEKARRALEGLYGKNRTELVDCEMRRIEEDVRFNQELQSTFEGPQYAIFGIEVGQELQCFRGKNLKRSLTAMLASSGQQLIGASFAIGYATYFFELIGVEQYFLTSCLMYVVMLLSTGAAFPMIEIVGRRTLIVPALFMLSGILLCMGIAGCFDTDAALWAIVVLMYLWALVYQISLGACGFVLASEVATLRLRASTQALVTVMNGIWGLVMQFTVPYMINPDAGNLGGKTGFIFFGTGLLTAIGGYFMFPETKVRIRSVLFCLVLFNLFADWSDPGHYL